MSLKAVHYINQFYAGLGGETMADTPFGVMDELKGPALGLNTAFKGEMTITKVIYAGDNYINTDENWDLVKSQIAAVIAEEKPDVFIAGPAFNAGRYGVACAKVCDYVRAELGVPSVTGMWWENPAVGMFVQNNYIIASTETATGMRKTLPAVANLALKLAKGEKIGPAAQEGYLETGHRNNEIVEKSGAERVVDMLVAKLYNKPYKTEVPHRGFEQVPPAPPVADMSKAKIALFTTGGLVPVGNPDKIKQAFAVSYGVYDMTGLDTLKKGVYESIHGGYDTTFASDDPHRLIPMDVIKDAVNEGVIGELYPLFGSTCGVGTNVASGQAMGADWAKRLKDSGVTAAILTSTWGTCTRCGATISKEMDRAGIPNVHINAFLSIAQSVGSNRIVFGGDFTAPTGNPDLPTDREKVYRRKIIDKALEVLQMEVSGPTIFTVDEAKEG